MKTYLTVWLSGLIAGLILVERWRRTGDRVVSAEETAGATLETGIAETSSMSPDKPPVQALVVAGVKADAERARHLLQQVGPWASTSAARFVKGGRSTPEPTPRSPSSPDQPT
jgi:hypothetical protein